MRKSLFRRIVNTFTMLALVIVSINFGQFAQAASLTTLSDNLTRLKTSTLADHTIKFVTPTGVAAGQSITLTFDADFTMGTFNVNNVDMATAATCGGSFTDKTLAASPATTTWGVTQVGQVITITSATDTITATNCVSIEIGANATSGASGTTQITNPSSAQVATLGVTAGPSDSGNTGIAIIDTPFDQVTVNATVDPTISFAISDSSIGFGTLTTANVRYATGDTVGSTSPVSAHDVTVATNATSGYTVYVQGATLGTGAGPTINAIGASALASSPNSEQFGMKVGASGGSGAALTPYDTANYAYNATATTQDDIASAAGASATTTFSITYIGNIAATTEAGAYSTTLTYTATGSF